MCLTDPLDIEKVLVPLSYLLYFKNLFWNHMLEEKCLTFSSFGPNSLSYSMLMLSCTHSCLDLIPRIIPRNYCRESRAWNSKEENCKIQCKIDGYTWFRSCFSLTNWKGKDALTFLSISSLNSFCSLAKMSLYFFRLFCHLFLFFYLPKVACGVNTLKFEVKWCHLITNSKWPLHVILARMESCCFSIG